MSQNTEIVHMDDSFGYNSAGNVHVDPDRVRELEIPMNSFIEAALVRRWNSIETGECLCGGLLRRFNREERRIAKKAKAKVWDGVVIHGAGCPAISTAISHWIINRPRELR